MRLSLLEKNRFCTLVGVVEMLPDVPCLTDRSQAHTANDFAFCSAIQAFHASLLPSLLYHRPFCLQLLSLLASLRLLVFGLVVVRIHSVAEGTLLEFVAIVFLIVRVVVRVVTMLLPLRC